MFALRWLNGPEPGQIYHIRAGTTVIGRGDECQIQIVEKGVSKQHAQIQVQGDRVQIKDLGSTNGVFVNGIRVSSSRLRSGDKILLDKCLFDLIEVRKTIVPIVRTLPSASGVRSAPQLPEEIVQDLQRLSQLAPAVAPLPEPETEPGDMPIALTVESEQPLNYLERVILPGVFRLAENFEIKQILAGSVIVYITTVTLLSVIPMARITKASIETESQRRAMTLARNLVSKNQSAIAQGVELGLDADLGREEGVKKALIVAAADGHILAPATLAGKYDGRPFIQEARKKEQDFVASLDASTIGASSPIKVFNAETGVQSIAAYAIVIYDMGSLAVDDGRILALLLQVLVIAVLLGLVLYFVLFRLIEQPIRVLNRSLDESLRENGQLDVKTPYQFSALNDLAANINGALGRIGSGGGVVSPDGGGLQAMEIERLSELIYGANLLWHAPSGTIQSVNTLFETLTGQGMNSLQGQSTQAILDQALRLNIEDLINRSVQSVGAPIQDSLEIGGHFYELIAICLSSGGAPTLVHVCIRPKEAA